MLDRWADVPADVRDALVASSFAIVWFTVFAMARSRGWHPGAPQTYVLAGVVTTAALLASRRLPLSTLVLTSLLYPIAYSAYSGTIRSEFHLFPTLVAGFVIATAGLVPARWVLAASVFGVTTLFLSPPGWARLAVALDRPSGLVGYVNVSEAVFAELLTVGTVFFGVAVRRARRSADLLQERNLELQALRRLESERVVAAERARIARELHDVVAHHMSAVVIRAQAADRVADADPQAPREAVRWIAGTGQEALASMRQVVRVLRARDATAALAPEDGLELLPAIAARMSSAGLAVALDVRAGCDDLTPRVQLAAVRIVQEALTNSLVHAGASRAAVTVRTDVESVEVRVDDDGTTGPPPAQDARWHEGVTRADGRVGHGLVGMRERALSCDGNLWLASSPLGGWRVTARLARVAT